MKIKNLLDLGHLSEALALAATAVQEAPEDPEKRSNLWELLCIAGDFERADNHLDILTTQNPETALRAGLYRWIIRAAQARLDCFLNGAVPDFINEPSPALQGVLKALVERRAGNIKKSDQILKSALALAPSIKGSCNNQNFSSLRDCDDWCAVFLEVLTSKGKYYWIPWESIDTLEVHVPEYPIDLIWRRAHLSMAGGIDGEVYLPAIYVETPKEHETARLGYQTDWVIKKNQPVHGIGQRLFITDNAEIPVMEIKQLIIAPREA